MKGSKGFTTKSPPVTNELACWRCDWARSGWTTVHSHPGRRAGEMSAGTVITEQIRILVLESASSGVRDFKGWDFVPFLSSNGPF